MTDAVYILGTGSKWQDNELRYSLRSLEKYVTGVRNVYVVGECPEWLTGVIHLPCKDEKPGNLVYKERNIMLKILRACAEPQLSKEFLFINDDHFFLAPVEAETYPNYYLENIPGMILWRNINDQYQASLKQTVAALKKTNLYDLFFDVHYPIIYNKAKFVSIMDAYDWNLPYGYVIKSLYANCMQLEGTPLEDDCKINGPVSVDGLHEYTDPKMLFSTGNQMDFEELETFLQWKFPDASKYEN